MVIFCLKKYIRHELYKIEIEEGVKEVTERISQNDKKLQKIYYNVNFNLAKHFSEFSSISE